MHTRVLALNVSSKLALVLHIASLAQFEDAVAREPKIQPTRADFRSPSGNQGIMLMM